MIKIKKSKSSKMEFMRIILWTETSKQLFEDPRLLLTLAIVDANLILFNMLLAKMDIERQISPEMELFYGTEWHLETMIWILLKWGNAFLIAIL
jgi:hypothetical protein